MVVRPQSVAFVLVSAAAALMWLGGPRPADGSVTATRELVPQTLGPWQGAPVEITDQVTKILETDDVAVMEYRAGEDQPIWFAQVAGFGNRAAFHPPELCYVGSHFEVLERGPVTVAVNGREFKVMRLVISQKQQQFEAWYWFTANGRMTPNYYQQQLWLALDSISGKPASGTLVRISTTRDDPQHSHRRLLTFLSFFEAAERTQARQRDAHAPDIS